VEKVSEKIRLPKLETRNRTHHRQSCRQPKVTDFEFPVLGNKDVGRFDVEVDNFAVVNVFQTLRRKKSVI
jgi:hypothetical protein